MKKEKERKIRPEQSQEKQPGIESVMKPRPEFEGDSSLLKLSGKAAIITGGDSGIGRAVAVLFAREGANILIAYLNEHTDAEETKGYVESYGRKCLLVPGDIGDEKHCKKIVEKAVKAFGKLDILVNNAAIHFPKDSILDIDKNQLELTFRTNFFSYFYMTKAALKYLKEGASIINTSSVTAYRGSYHLIDYASTKGAVVSFTRSLSSSLADKGIRVNGVAPGPIWTPLIPSSLKPKEVSTFGSDVPMGRAGEPDEVAPSFLFLACDDSKYMTGQFLHPNGGEIINA